MRTKKKKIAFVSDFDGTITDKDFFDYTTSAYLDQSALIPWNDYLKGKITHFDALKEMYSQIRVPKKDLIELIHQIKIDDYLYKVLKLCRDNQIPLSICSAGNDYYIKELLSKEIQEFDITLITNPATYDEHTGLLMSRPKKEDFYYDHDVGISKEKVVLDLKNRGFFVVFAGDGLVDFAPARIADIVFAKRALLSKCNEACIKTERFESFLDIYNSIKALL